VDTDDDHGTHGKAVAPPIDGDGCIGIHRFSPPVGVPGRYRHYLLKSCSLSVVFVILGNFQRRRDCQGTSLPSPNPRTQNRTASFSSRAKVAFKSRTGSASPLSASGKVPK